MFSKILTKKMIKIFTIFYQKKFFFHQNYYFFISSEFYIIKPIFTFSNFFFAQCQQNLRKSRFCPNLAVLYLPYCQQFFFRFFSPIFDREIFFPAYFFLPCSKP